MAPTLKKLEFSDIQKILSDDAKSEIVFGLADNHVFVSYDMGISWRKIENISGSEFPLVDDQAPDEVKIRDTDDPHIYFVNVKGEVKEISRPEDIIDFTRHRKDPNAIIIKCAFERSDNEKRDDSECYALNYYTKDGGTSWQEMESNKDAKERECAYEPYYRFVGGSEPGLIYKQVNEYNRTDQTESEWTEYARDFFSESPLVFTKFPFKVFKSQDIFFGLKDYKEFHVSKNGVDFEHVKFPHSPSCENSIGCSIVDGLHSPLEKRTYSEMSCSNKVMAQHSDLRFKGSIFLTKYYAPLKPKYSTPLYTTLFRYDIQSNEIKFIVDYCYDFTVVLAEEGILIANVITNPQELSRNHAEPQIKSLITFNDGKDWQNLVGPSGVELSIVNGTLANDVIPSVPGLLIVHGKEGPIEHYKMMEEWGTPRLDLLPTFSTYMTKDSGKTWSKIHDIVMDWAVGGNGEIIVLYSRLPRNHIFYSLDSGETWERLHVGLLSLSELHSDPETDQVDCPVEVQTPHSCTSSRFLISSNEYSDGLYYSLSFDPIDHKE